MPETTIPTPSLRELAIQAADAGDRTAAETIARVRLEEMERCRSIATDRAIWALGEIAEAAQWTARDEATAEAVIGGERFRYRVRDLHDRRGELLHVTDCPNCGGERTATAHNLYHLGKLLRDGDSLFGRYACAVCDAAKRAESEQAEATAPSRPLPDRGDAAYAAADAASFAMHTREMLEDTGRSSSEVITLAARVQAAAAESQAWAAVVVMLDGESQ